MKLLSIIFLFLSVTCTWYACQKDPYINPPPIYNPTSYTLQIPSTLPPITLNEPLYKERIDLGKKLFFDPILSKDSTQSCSSCHNQNFGFTDHGLAFSKGVDGIGGNRNAMPLFNLLYFNKFFWDGRSASLEEQALEPVPNPIEMHLPWQQAENRLNNHEVYPDLFFNAFGIYEITKELVAAAIAQFEMTLLSANSRYDKAVRQEIFLTDAEVNGLEIFSKEPRKFPSDAPGGDCFHCHSIGSRLFMDNDFHNNGLDSVLIDKGLGEITHNTLDDGKFKTPSLRNVEYTAPYMHDGRFQTLEEVVEFYNSGVKSNSPNIAPVMIKSGGITAGLNLTSQEKADLVAFLKALSDEEFMANPEYQQ